MFTYLLLLHLLSITLPTTRVAHEDNYLIELNTIPRHSQNKDKEDNDPVFFKANQSVYQRSVIDYLPLPNLI